MAVVGRETEEEEEEEGKTVDLLNPEAGPNVI